MFIIFFFWYHQGKNQVNGLIIKGVKIDRVTEFDQTAMDAFKAGCATMGYGYAFTDPRAAESLASD